MSASIEIDNVTKRYGALTVLDDISLSIEAGEFVVFLGPSGCGKSTLLRMIAGLEDVTSGTISVSGSRVDTLPPGQRGVAMVFQSYALYPHMTVKQNMSFGLENIGMPRDEIEKRVLAAAETLEIGHLLDRKPQKLSGGQRQRVAIGRAIVKEPKAFLFDEPLSNLDAALRGRTRLELAQLHHRLGSTMIFVTHDQIEAMTLADRIVIMNARKIEQIGTPMDVYQRPATRFVAGFIGSPPMNFLPVSGWSGTSKGLSVSTAGLGAVETGFKVPAGLNPEGATLGIRAEDITVLTDGTSGVPLTAEVVERLGDRSLVYGVLDDGSKLVVEADGRSLIKAGDRLMISADPHAFHLFGADGRAFGREGD
ncbi:ABC transporter ATP-binding protein [Rhizobium rosettiformans]|uniref:ABC transporter ATP-binding protein n=1 Tax=Rhizobium rosettiformans TaxID=1368430 RepID=UPI0028555EF5|nr:sn-glycerol-3-phosphate ABC transporter ATP-binding protein UgpC [Rhizobium rosettiformans]MDR7030728.1 multiple sugar transport system ATP-binding protein [Rhizobium rosettiformans]MDR7062651.1 multiple sugar transport system ATP-binding protein [Rhizobium rosettiformans]